MTNRELIEIIRSIFDGLGELQITAELIAMRDQKKIELNQGDRPDHKFTMDVDCLMLEEWLISLGKVNAPLLEHRTQRGACVYDAIINNAFIDFKCVAGNLYYNLSADKFIKKNNSNSTYIDWVQESINLGHLTHYCFYQMHRPDDRPLIEGDVVKFELINVLNSQYVLNSLIPSKFDGKFYKVKKYEQ